MEFSTSRRRIDSDSVDILERKLDRVWSREPMKYNPDEDKLTCTWRMQSGQELDLTGETSAWGQKWTCNNL